MVNKLRDKMEKKVLWVLQLLHINTIMNSQLYLKLYNIIHVHGSVTRTLQVVVLTFL